MLKGRTTDRVERIGADDKVRNTAPLSVTRVLHILSALSAAEEPVTLARLSRALEVPKSSLISLLRGLVKANFVYFSDGAYRLGPSAFELGSALVDARRRFHISDEIREVMRDLSNRCGETVLFAVLNRDDATTMTYLDIVESRNPIRIAATIGGRRPLYCTAGGRMLLSSMPDEQVRRYLDIASLEKLNTHTEVSKTKLFKAVQLARKEEFSCVYDEVAEGISGIAALVSDGTGTAVGVLIVAMPTSRPADKGSRLVSLVRDAARAASRRLGYREPATAK